MVQPEVLLSQLQSYSGRPGATTILDAWHAYFDAHGVPYMALLDRLAYHANLRGVSISDVWTGDITVPSQTLISAAPGFAYDISNISTLWQDTAGTIPVTEPGDPVARVDDVSSRGNHATQNVGTSMPTYQVDANGKGYLQFDGLDDFLVTPSIDLSAHQQALLLFAFYRDAYAAGVLMEQTALYTGTPGAWLANVTGAGNVTFAARGSATNAAASATPGTVPGPFVAASLVDVNAATAADAFRNARLNGTAFQLSASVNPTNTSLANAAVYIAARAGTSLFLQGRFYGAVVRGGNVPLTTQQALEDYYAERAGL
jgi:hypothetical protein